MDLEQTVREVQRIKNKVRHIRKSELKVKKKKKGHVNRNDTLFHGTKLPVQTPDDHHSVVVRKVQKEGSETIERETKINRNVVN